MRKGLDRVGFCRSISVTAAVGLSGCLSAPPDSVDPPGIDPGPVDDGLGDGGPADGPEDGIDLVPTGPPNATESVGGSGGGPFSVKCPPDRFVTGLGAWDNGGGISAVWARCSRFRIGPSDRVELVDTVDGDVVEGDPDSVDLGPADCPPGLVAVGYDGSVNFNDVVSHLRLGCAAIDWDGALPTIGAVTETSALLGEEDTPVIAGTCVPGRAAAGISGRYGLLIDQFQLDCYAVEARPAP